MKAKSSTPCATPHIRPRIREDAWDPRSGSGIIPILMEGTELARSWMADRGNWDDSEGVVTGAKPD
eukprot:5616278-Amphidinium_carterae.1